VVCGICRILLSRYSRLLVLYSCQVVFEKMTVANALSNSILFFASSGFMVQAAMSRIGKGLNVPFHLLLMSCDIAGRLLILEQGFSSSVYLIYANAMMGTPLAVGALRLLNHEARDIQSVALAVAYGVVAFMAIVITPLAVSLGETLTGDNYFSSYYWILLSILTVIGICLLILSFGFTVASDLLRKAEENDSKDSLNELLARRNLGLTQRLNELEKKYMVASSIVETKERTISNTIHDLREPLHALRFKMHNIMQGNSKNDQDVDDINQTFGYLENLVSSHLAEDANVQILDANESASANDQSDEGDHATVLSADVILGSVYEMFLPDADRKSLVLEYNRTDHEVDVDALVLMRIASNLVSNAIKYTQKGTVSFGLSEVDGKIRLEVQDTGVGMTPDAFATALEHNVRLKQGADRAEGNGYGLSIIRELTEKHKLKLSLCPKRKEGTGVLIEFPAKLA